MHWRPSPQPDHVLFVRTIHVSAKHLASRAETTADIAVHGQPINTLSMVPFCTFLLNRISCVVKQKSPPSNAILKINFNKTRSSADDDKPARRVERSAKVTKHSTIPYDRYSFLLCNSNFVFKTRHFYDIRLQEAQLMLTTGSTRLIIIISV